MVWGGKPRPHMIGALQMSAGFSIHKNRVVYYDVLTVCAAFAVVVLHCNGSVHVYSSSFRWTLSLLIEVLFFWAVPVFFMLTGAKTLSYRDRYSTKEFLIRRCKRIFIPYLAWSAFLYVYRFGIIGDGVSALSITGFIDAFMNNTIEPTYWFFIAMIGVTLSVPIISLIISNHSAVRYLILGTFLLSSVLPYVFGFLGLPWNVDFSIQSSSIYIMYLLIGYEISKPNFQVSYRGNCLLTALSMSSFVFRFVYTYLTSSQAMEVNRLLFSYGAFTAVFPSVWIFLTFKKLEPVFTSRMAGRGGRLLTSASQASFGIYLIHKLLLDNFICGTMHVSINSLWLKTVGPIVVFTSCWTIVTLLRKIPGFKALIP